MYEHLYRCIKQDILRKTPGGEAALQTEFLPKTWG